MELEHSWRYASGGQCYWLLTRVLSQWCSSKAVNHVASPVFRVVGVVASAQLDQKTWPLLVLSIIQRLCLLIASYFSYFSLYNPSPFGRVQMAGDF